MDTNFPLLDSTTTSDWESIRSSKHSVSLKIQHRRCFPSYISSFIRYHIFRLGNYFFSTCKYPYRSPFSGNDSLQAASLQASIIISSTRLPAYKKSRRSRRDVERYSNRRHHHSFGPLDQEFSQKEETRKVDSWFGSTVIQVSKVQVRSIRSLTTNFHFR